MSSVRITTMLGRAPRCEVRSASPAALDAGGGAATRDASIAHPARTASRMPRRRGVMEGIERVSVTRAQMQVRGERFGGVLRPGGPGTTTGRTLDVGAHLLVHLLLGVEGVLLLVVVVQELDALV